MIPVVFINCKRIPFLFRIITNRKPFETRTRNTLGRFLGERVLFAETGSGKPVVKCSAVIDFYISVRTRDEWEKYREKACIPVGSEYDWNDSTKVKWLYHLADVRTCEYFVPDLGPRHGYVWAEYSGSYHELNA